ncbi:DUF2794 domain-containing protein [Alphaproteobacteria bacterium]|nr:DUF2794 domain-containing protein [Alphaproteobacteria bacterium]
MTILNFKLNNSKVSNVLKLGNNNHKKTIFFSKLELTSILSLYSKQVSRGFWKDYALDSQNGTAIFSIFRHTHDKPIYQIIKKRLKGVKNINEFYILNDSGLISKSTDLLMILNKFEKKLSIRKYQIH